MGGKIQIVLLLNAKETLISLNIVEERDLLLSTAGFPKPRNGRFRSNPLYLQHNREADGKGSFFLGSF